jgi:hypothetical protein
MLAESGLGELSLLYTKMKWPENGIENWVNVVGWTAVCLINTEPVYSERLAQPEPYNRLIFKKKISIKHDFGPKCKHSFGMNIRGGNKEYIHIWDIFRAPSCIIGLRAFMPRVRSENL